MKSSIFIPKKINVGFQSRSGTYTGKLAYVIYYDEKGKLRKETSWNGWRDNKIPNEEFDNAPTSGFVLNKKVGDYSSGWNHRSAYCRVYDPRNFEFEISIENLLYILENANSIKGKGLEGEFVYGWDGKDLILMPVESPDYKELQEYNSKLHGDTKIKAKDLKIGATYLTKANGELIYIGKFDKWKEETSYYRDKSYYSSRVGWSIDIDDTWTVEGECAYRWINKGKHFYFCYFRDGKFAGFNEYKTISGKLIGVIADNCIDNYAEILDKLECDTRYSPIDKSKEEIIPYECDEFCEAVSKLTGYYNYKIFYNKGNESFKVYNNDGKPYVERHVQETDGWSRQGKYVKEHYEIEELFNHVQPTHKDLYLSNGKFYKRER